MKKIIILILLVLPFVSFSQQIRWEQIKPISAQVEKASPVDNDLLLLEDSEDGGARKYIKLSSISVDVDLQSAYDGGDSIKTNSSSGAFKLISDTGNDSDNIFEGYNNSGSITSKIKGDGKTEFNETKININNLATPEINGLSIVNSNSLNGNAAILFNVNSSYVPKGAFFFERTEAYGRGRFHIALNDSANNSDMVEETDIVTTWLKNGNVGFGTLLPKAKLHTTEDASGLLFPAIYENLNGATNDGVGFAFSVNSTTNKKGGIAFVRNTSFGRGKLSVLLNNDADLSNTLTIADEVAYFETNGDFTVDGTISHIDGVLDSESATVGQLNAWDLQAVTDAGNSTDNIVNIGDSGFGRLNVSREGSGVIAEFFANNGNATINIDRKGTTPGGMALQVITNGASYINSDNTLTFSANSNNASKINTDGTTDFYYNIEAPTAKFTTGASDGAFLQSDASGNGTWTKVDTLSTNIERANWIEFVENNSSGSSLWTEDTNGITYADNVGIGSASYSDRGLIIDDPYSYAGMTVANRNTSSNGVYGVSVQVESSGDNTRAIAATNYNGGEFSAAVYGYNVSSTTDLHYGGIFNAGLGSNGIGVSSTGGLYGGEFKNNGTSGVAVKLDGEDSAILTTFNTAPSSSSDTGTAGEIRFTTDYIYICTATDTWKRVAISTW